MPTERYQRYHEEKAKGGLAMTMFGGSSNISVDSPSLFGQLDMGSDEIIPHLRRFSERIHAHDTALMCQITHMGHRTVWDQGAWLAPLAPSHTRDKAHRAFPKAMEHTDIKSGHHRFRAGGPALSGRWFGRLRGVGVFPSDQSVSDPGHQQAG